MQILSHPLRIRWQGVTLLPMSIILLVSLFFVSRKVPESGNYTFFVACDDTCELWLRTEGEFEEHVDKIKDEGAYGKLLLIKLDSLTDHNQWNK